TVIGRRRTKDDGARSGRRRQRRPGRKFQVEQRRDHPEPGAQVEAEGLGVEALVHEPDLGDAAPAELDGTLEQPTPDAAALRTGIDGDGADGGDRAARMDPGEAQYLAVLLGDGAAEWVDRQQMADVTATLGRRADAGRQAVRHRDAVEGDEVEVAHALDVALLDGPQREAGHWRAAGRPPSGGGGSGVTK